MPTVHDIQTHQRVGLHVFVLPESDPCAREPDQNVVDETGGRRV